MSLIADILRDIPISSWLRERLVMAEDELEALRDEKLAFEKKYVEFAEELRDLSQKHAKLRQRMEGFEEFRGGLFKRWSQGGYHEAVYCPGCHFPMSSLEPHMPYHCERCKITLDIKGRELDEILLNELSYKPKPPTSDL